MVCRGLVPSLRPLRPPFDHLGLKMSAGLFNIVSYPAEYAAGEVHKIRIQPETAALSIGGTANTPPTDAPTSPISAMVSKSKRGLGLHAATVTLKSTATTASPAGYALGSVTTIPLLNADIRLAASVATSATAVSYLGVTTWKVYGYSPEKAK